MTAYNFTTRQNNPTQPGTHTIYADFIGSAALADEDTITGIKVPGNARVLSAEVDHIGLDTDASATLTFDFGDTNDPNRFISGAAAADSGAFVNSKINVAAQADGVITTGRGYRYAAATSAQAGIVDTMLLTVTAPPATGGTTPQVRVAVTYSVDY